MKRNSSFSPQVSDINLQEESVPRKGLCNERNLIVSAAAGLGRGNQTTTSTNNQQSVYTQEISKIRAFPNSIETSKKSA